MNRIRRHNQRKNGVLPGRVVLLSAVVMFHCVRAQVISDADRPETWFHLIGGNVSKAGLVADLEAVKAAGIGGIQFFHGLCILFIIRCAAMP